jgi:hypothetical protein
VSVHVDEPVAQLVTPVWQLFAGVQAAFAVHATQEPLLQTWFVPQDVPFGTVVPWSTHTEAPVEQLVFPS